LHVEHAALVAPALHLVDAIAIRFGHAQFQSSE
jgi:hypothetical protein